MQNSQVQVQGEEKAYTVSGIPVEVSGLHAELPGAGERGNESLHSVSDIGIGLKNACRGLKSTFKDLRTCAQCLGYVEESHKCMQGSYKHVQYILKSCMA